MAATADEVLPRAKHGATNGRHRLLGAVPLYFASRYYIGGGISAQRYTVIPAVHGALGC